MRRRLNVISAEIEENNRFGLRAEPGWTGVFTRQQAEGAIPNGAAIRKSRAEDGDTMPVGALGSVLGSLRDPKHPTHPNLTFYFVEWTEMPGFAIAVAETKIEAVRP